MLRQCLDNLDPGRSAPRAVLRRDRDPQPASRRAPFVPRQRRRQSFADLSRRDAQNPCQIRRAEGAASVGQGPVRQARRASRGGGHQRSSLVYSYSHAFRDDAHCREEARSSRTDRADHSVIELLDGRQPLAQGGAFLTRIPGHPGHIVGLVSVEPGMSHPRHSLAPPGRALIARATAAGTRRPSGRWSSRRTRQTPPARLRAPHDVGPDSGRRQERGRSVSGALSRVDQGATQMVEMSRCDPTNPPKLYGDRRCGENRQKPAPPSW